MKSPFAECSSLSSSDDEIEEIFTKLIAEIYKEDEDLYPYNIKNSTLNMNFIRRSHKHFNVVLICFLAIIIVYIHIFYLRY